MKACFIFIVISFIIIIIITIIIIIIIIICINQISLDFKHMPQPNIVQSVQ